MVISDLFGLWDKSELFIIIEEVLGLKRHDIFLNPGYEIPDEKIDLIKDMIEKRKRHIPLQYIIGKWWFYDFEIEIRPGVLIPRPETELLVEKAIQISRPGMNILDIGTGSGVIAIALAKHIKDANVFAVDKSEEAIELAKLNARKNSVDIDFRLGDLYNPVEGIKFDIIATNPPYIESEYEGKLKPELSYEPHDALYSGEDGLDCIKEIIEKSDYYINKKGIILIEIGFNQGKKVKEILDKKAYTDIEIIKDYNGFDRLVKAEWHG
ncbi:MAG: peptide chain release factor N(5)-glutamine methyltransferase [Tissierellia bacterium]|nr:peptide chain release factor N(5)-glutamine methyltransferase [Tissierellia bacterium]